MSRNLTAALALVGTSLFAAPVLADGLSEHTYMITWAADNCEGFTYAEDLLMHANRAVFDAPEAEVTALREKTEAGLNDMYEGDKVEYCDLLTFLIENPEEE